MNQAALNFSLAKIMPAAQATGLFPSLATITAPPAVQGPTGNPSGSWTAIPGRTNIPCQDAPASIARIQATELKDVAEIMAKGLRHVLLNQCFVTAPTWAGLGYRCIVDSIEYQLLGAENDSQLMQTRLDLQLVSI